METLPIPRGPKRQIDWRLVAQLLAEGHSTTEVATVMGCSRQHIWRILRSSEALRARTSELRRRETTEAAVRLHGLRAMAIETIHQAIADGNKRMSCWLVERLGLFRTPSLEEMAGDGEAGADQLDSETVLDMADAVHDVARATRILDAAEQDVSYATERAEVTSPPDQGDKQVTVTCRNALSPPDAIVTRNGMWPPAGVFAE
jgi:hypothetical protein